MPCHFIWMRDTDDAKYLQQPPSPAPTISALAEKHYAWAVKMGWTKATPLESLALIASEIGEAVNECRGKKPTEKLGAELADIVLSTMGLAKGQGIDLEAEIIRKMAVNDERGSRGRVI